jgi:hypothetical protein
MPFSRRVGRWESRSTWRAVSSEAESSPRGLGGGVARCLSTSAITRWNEPVCDSSSRYSRIVAWRGTPCSIAQG